MVIKPDFAQSRVIPKTDNIPLDNYNNTLYIK